MQNKPNARYDHVYAIVRVDKGCVTPNGVFDRQLLTVTKVLRCKENADREIERLNRLNSGKSCTYFSLMTRLERSE